MNDSCSRSSELTAKPQHDALSQLQRADVLDAPLIDDYLNSLLSMTLDDSSSEAIFHYFPKAFQQRCLHALQSFLIPSLTIFLSRGQTPALHALGLRLRTLSPQGLSFPRHLRLFWYSILSFGLPLIYQRAKALYYNGNNPSNIIHGQQQTSSRSSTQQQQLAQERRQRAFQRLFRTVDTLLHVLRLACLLRCWSGSGKAPNLALLMAGLSYEKSSTGHPNPSSFPGTAMPELHVLYAHRRWLHLEVMRIVPLFATPFLFSLRESREWLRDSWSQIAIRLPRIVKDDTGRPAEGCPVCHSNPILVPFVTNCGHTYCYTCLWSQLRFQSHPSLSSHRDISSFDCHVCSALINECRPSLAAINRQTRK